MMRSASSRTTSILCSTSRMVLLLSSLSLRIRFRITGASAAFMPAVGSSNMNTCDSSAISSATSSLRWSPCGRLATSSCSLPAMRHGRQDLVRALRPGHGGRSRCSTGSGRAGARRRALACTASRTFSSTVRRGNRLVSWKARPRPARVRSEADRPDRSRPSSVTWPARRLELAGDQVEIGGLAGAVGADDGRQRARLERAGHGVDGHVAAEADGQVVGGELAHGFLRVSDALRARRAPAAEEMRIARNIVQRGPA